MLHIAFASNDTTVFCKMIFAYHKNQWASYTMSGYETCYADTLEDESPNYYFYRLDGVGSYCFEGGDGHYWEVEDNYSGRLVWGQIC